MIELWASAPFSVCQFFNNESIHTHTYVYNFYPINKRQLQNINRRVNIEPVCISIFRELPLPSLESSLCDCHWAEVFTHIVSFPIHSNPEGCTLQEQRNWGLGRSRDSPMPVANKTWKQKVGPILQTCSSGSFNNHKFL